MGGNGEIGGRIPVAMPPPQPVPLRGARAAFYPIEQTLN